VQLVARKLKAARTLPARDWGIFVEAWLRLLVADLSVRILPFRWLSRTLRASHEPLAGDGAIIERVTRIFALAARNHVASTNCLRRSLALRGMLVRRGVPAVMRVGARTTGGDLVAHAWVEVDGRAVGDAEREVADFQVFR
jgi:hypothetical protein